MKDYSIQTLSTLRQAAFSDELPSVMPIFQNTSFEFRSLQEAIDIFSGKQDGFVYSRYDNPTVSGACKAIATLEVNAGDTLPVCLMTSSGMSAITSCLMTLLNKGDILLTHHGVYGGTSEVLNILRNKIQFEIQYVDFMLIDQLDISQFANKKIFIYFESPANPLLNVVDLDRVILFSKNAKITTIMDNTVAGPFIQRPLMAGVDFLIYSTTKYHSGHGASTAGCILSFHEQLMLNEVSKTIRLCGANCAPFEAWITALGLNTFYLRFQKQSENATTIALYLNNHPKCLRVHHPSLNSHSAHHYAKNHFVLQPALMSFELNTNQAGVHRFFNSLKLIKHAATLGDLNSLVLHPATSSHRNIEKELLDSQGITFGLVRFSCGVEDVNDLINDFELAFSCI